MGRPQRSAAEDSLFCEWAYVVDLDENKFEVYRGFQNEPHDDGRFAAASPQNGGYEGANHLTVLVRNAAGWRFDAPAAREEVRLRRIGDAYVQFAMENPHHYQIMFMTRTPAR